MVPNRSSVGNEPKLALTEWSLIEHPTIERRSTIFPCISLLHNNIYLNKKIENNTKNKTGLQTVSRPVEKIVDFFQGLKKLTK